MLIQGTEAKLEPPILLENSEKSHHAAHRVTDQGRYISLERLVEEHKGRYYETLDLSSSGWREGAHDPQPYINFSLFVLKTAYKEFEERLGQVQAPRGEKTALVIRAAQQARRTFRVAVVQRECPGVSLDLIRVTLKDLQRTGRVECLGRSRSAEWKKTARR